MIQLSCNENARHKAVLFLRAEVHEINQFGECSGRPVEKIENVVLSLEGMNKDICIRKLNELVEELKQRCHD